MYIFEPGAGMSGVARKVEPGEDFNATWSDSVSTSSNVSSNSGYASTMTSEVHSSYDCTQFVSATNSTKR